MIRELNQVALRSRDTLLQDAVGALALAVILIGSLHVPSFF
jgi:hypothetical protein